MWPLDGEALDGIIVGGLSVPDGQAGEDGPVSGRSGLDRGALAEALHDPQRDVTERTSRSMRPVDGGSIRCVRHRSNTASQTWSSRCSFGST
jgi:hypothetical protein